MSFKLEFLEKDGGVITTYWGIMTDEDAIQSGLEKYAALNKYKIIRYSLADLSRVKRSDLTSKGVRNNVEMTSKILKVLKDVLIIFVLPNDVDYGMGRMWQAYAENQNISSHIFRSRKEAEKFIKNHMKKFQNKQDN